MFNIPNLFTAGNMLCGIMAIFFSFSGRIEWAAFFIFGGAVLDFFDGFLARILKQQGEMGKQLDSLADMITFGLAPGIMMMVVLAYATTSPSLWHGILPDKGIVLMADTLIHPVHEDVTAAFYNWKSDLLDFEEVNWIPFAALLIPFFSMFRLAKFNIDTRQSESFIGLPTPANTIFFTAFPLLITQFGNIPGWQHDLIMQCIQPVVLIPIIVVMSLLLVAELPLFALKFKSFAWKGNEIRYIFLISCGLLIPLLLIWSVPIIVLLYLLLSFIQNIIRKKQTHEIQS